MQLASDVRIKKLVKTFGDVVAVDGIDLDIPRGAFVTILGPSGCGKTTTLRLIGGFDRPDSGEILIQGTRVTETPPHLRDTSMVFQSYALFPHLTVHENIGYGLRERGVNPGEIRTRVGEMLDLIELPDIADRKPGQLSGGQQQRVALARSLVVRPAVLLLDEPLGALDLMLRKQMQIELKRIQRQVGITFVYVTHDQDEALLISDHIVVMRAGRIEQQGTARQVFEQPASRYVADFLGASNILPVRVASRNADHANVIFAGRTLTVSQSLSSGSGPVALVIRPERIHLDSGNGWQATVIERAYKGSSILYRLRLQDGTEVLVDHPQASDGRLFAPGGSVMFSFRSEDASLVPAWAG